MPLESIPSEQSSVDDVLAVALRSAASALDGKSVRHERELEHALRDALRDAGLTATRQGSIDVRPAWEGRVGPCDLAVHQGDHAPVGVEVKWGGSNLWNCSWDVAKLATCLALGQLSRVYLAAGAAEADWSKPCRGSDLFAAREWHLSELLDTYAKDFAFWREDVAVHPKRIPRRWAVSEAATAPLTANGAPHELRLVRLDLLDPSMARVRFQPVVN